MDKGRLAELVPDAQDYILRLREYQTDVEALQPPIEELRSRMTAVMDFYIDLYCGLHQIGRKSDEPLVLDKVEATEATDEEPAQPAGVVEVAMNVYTYRQSPNGGGMEWMHHYSRDLMGKFDSFDTRRPKEAVRLKFAFRATDDDLKKEGHSESSFTLPDSEEEAAITISHKEQTAAGVMESPSKHQFDFDKNGPERLKAYKEEYLRQRTLEIEWLEASKKLIQEALQDLELNPWAEGLDLAALRHKRATAAYKVAYDAWWKDGHRGSMPPEKADFGL